MLRDDVFSRIRSIVFDRYDQDIPASLIEDYSRPDVALNAIRRFESFKADTDLLDLFEAFHKIMIGNYGNCLFCRREIDVSKLMGNPLTRFCDECERILNLSYIKQEVEHL